MQQGDDNFKAKRLYLQAKRLYFMWAIFYKRSSIQMTEIILLAGHIRQARLKQWRNKNRSYLKRLG